MNYSVSTIAILPVRLSALLGSALSNLQWERESKKYEACTFDLEDRRVICRTAKVTPTKTGQFVTLWKRTDEGPIQPFDAKDEIDLIVINVYSGVQAGQFIFPPSVLIQQNVISNAAQPGKRALRVYPPWDIAGNKQAKATQAWQLPYFLHIDEEKPIDVKRANQLYGL